MRSHRNNPERNIGAQTREAVYQPRPGGSGFARKRDVEDRSNQAAAPTGVSGHYDRTGEDRYEEGLEEFEQEQTDGLESDDGGVQSGRVTTRSDEQIRTDVQSLLRSSDDLDAADIEVAVADGVVTLSGTVDGSEERRHAGHLVATVPGVHDVLNALDVDLD